MTILHRGAGIVLLALVCTSFAPGQVRIGVHGGANLSDVTEPPNYDHAGTWEMRTYGFGGIVADVHIAQHWLLATEVNFIQKGIRIPNTAWGLALYGTTTLTANYFEVPLKIRYRSGADPFGWYVEGGPSLALLESGWAHTVIQHIAGIPDTEETNSIRGLYRTFQPSFMAGAGAEYQLTGGLTLAFSASYALGLSDVYDDYWPDTKSRGGQCGVGVLVAL